MKVNLKNVTNIEFTGYEHVKELNKEVPSFVLYEPTAEEWNKRARIQNEKMFIQTFKRKPNDYEEVRGWLDSYREK